MKRANDHFYTPSSARALMRIKPMRESVAEYRVAQATPATLKRRAGRRMVAVLAA